LDGTGEHKLEGTFDSSPGGVRSVEASADDRAFLTIERRMEIVKTINVHKTATVGASASRFPRS